MIHPSAARSAAVALTVSLCFLARPGSSQAQTTAPPACGSGLVFDPTPVQPSPGWFAGDTHDHLQNCHAHGGGLRSLTEVVELMEEEGLTLSSVLVFDPATGESFGNHACLVTGMPHPISTPSSIVQFGVETSGLTASRWGHLIGLGIGPDEARIARADPDQGDCYLWNNPMGLACPGPDGSGFYPTPVARFFGKNPAAVRGYAHQAWTVGIYHPDGYDWASELLATGFTTDALVLDPLQRLAFPDVQRLLYPGAAPATFYRAIFTPFAPIDVALGNVEFIETVGLREDYSFGHPVPSAWYGSLYKLWSSGLRPSIGAGSDRGCRPPSSAADPTRLYAHVRGQLTYDHWTEAIAAGRVTVAQGRNVFLDLDVEGRGPGEGLEVAPGVSFPVDVTVRASTALEDELELVVDGKVAASLAIDLPAGGETTWNTVLQLSESSWVAARLCSQNAHTAPVYVIVGGRPIVDAEAAEYWMIWCDAMAKAIRDFPGAFFACQEDEVLSDIETARSIFRALRDRALGGPPGLAASRFGRSTAACRGPLSAGVLTAPMPGQLTTWSCLSAPPESDGWLYLSAAPYTPGRCFSPWWVEVFLEPNLILSAGIPTRSLRSGYAEASWSVPGYMFPGTEIFGQFVFRNEPGCIGIGCSGAPSAFSASDAFGTALR